MRVALLASLLLLQVGTVAQAADRPPPAMYALHLTVLTPQGNAWGDYDRLFEGGTVQSLDAPAQLSHTDPGQCPRPGCPWQGTMANVEVAFVPTGLDDAGRVQGTFRVGVATLRRGDREALGREATGTLDAGGAVVDLPAAGSIPGYRLELAARPITP